MSRIDISQQGGASGCRYWLRFLQTGSACLLIPPQGGSVSALMVPVHTSAAGWFQPVLCHHPLPPSIHQLKSKDHQDLQPPPPQASLLQTTLYFCQYILILRFFFSAQQPPGRCGANLSGALSFFLSSQARCLFRRIFLKPFEIS